MRSDLVSGARPPVVFAFITPLAATGSVRHAEKLLRCLGSVNDLVLAVCDRRVNLIDQPNVERALSVPTLHYVHTRRPIWWSATLWIAKLVWVQLCTSWKMLRIRGQVDVVICFLASYYTPILLWGRLLRKKVIVVEAGNELATVATIYGTGVAARLLRALLWLERETNRRLAHVCVVETLALVDASGLARHVDKVRKAHLYVDTGFYRPLVPFEEREAVVGYVGRLVGGKGLESLLEAARLLRGAGLRFKIVGSGFLDSQVRLTLQNQEMSHVRLGEAADAAGVVEHLNSLRLMVLPSESEGLPNTVLEAMACGTPVLATPVGGIPDLITHELTGFLLPSTHPRALADAIQRSLADPSLALVAERGRVHVVEHYSLPAAAETWRRVLEEPADTTSMAVRKSAP